MKTMFTALPWQRF